MKGKIRRIALLFAGIIILGALLAVTVTAAEKSSSSGPKITTDEQFNLNYSYCHAPTFTITSDVGLKHVKVEHGYTRYTKKDGKFVTEKVFETFKGIDSDVSGESYQVVTSIETKEVDNDGDGKNDKVDFCEFKITATDQNDGETVHTFVVAHFLGSRSTIIIPATCTTGEQQVSTQNCKFCNEAYLKKVIKTSNELSHLPGDVIAVFNPCEAEKLGQEFTGDQTICRRCGKVLSYSVGAEVEFDDSAHTWVNDGAPPAQEATCEKAGFTYQKCSKCGAIKANKTEEPKGHTLGKTEKISDATCTEGEKYGRKCSTCGTYVDVYCIGQPLGHKYVVDGDNTPNCTESKICHAKCSRCEKEIDNYEIKPTGHSYELQTTLEPTCSTEGKKQKVCKTCGYVDESSTQTIPKKDHVLEPDDYNCTTPRNCSVCGEEIIKAEAEHTFGEWKQGSGYLTHVRSCTAEGCSYTENGEHEGMSSVGCGNTFKCTICNLGGCRNHMAHRPTDGPKALTAASTLSKAIPDTDLDNATPGYHAIYCQDCFRILNASGTGIGSLSAHDSLWTKDRTDCTVDIYCSCGKLLRKGSEGHNYTNPIDVGDPDVHELDCYDYYCKQTITEPHDWNYKVYTTNQVDATCTTPGSYVLVHECKCGALKEEDVTIPVKDHEFGEVIVETSPDCDSDGYSYKECKNCRFRENITISMEGHSWESDYTIDKPATCTSDGSKSIHCSKCGAHDKEEAIPQTGHLFGTEYETVTEATCTDSGIRDQICSVCGEKGEAETIPAKGHTYGDYKCDENATCTSRGTQSRSCTVCGYKDPVTLECTTHIPQGHQWSEWVENNDATFEKDGTKQRECTVCGETETETIPDSKLHEHFFSVYNYNNDATCDKDGTETAVCDKCGIAADTRTKEGTALGHSFTVWTYNGDAKCGIDGTETSVCDRCGIAEETRTDEGSALEHVFKNYVYQGGATCEQNGVETADCDNGCGTKDSREAQGTALGHNFASYVHDGNATCDSNGTETATCENGCGKKDTRAASEGAGHIWSHHPVFTWSEDGKTAKAEFTCERDPKHTKVYDATVREDVENQPTCETDGSKTRQASVTVDGVEYVDSEITDVIPATGHSWSEPKFEWSEDSKTATAVFTCNNNAQHIKKVSAKITSSETKKPECEKDGEAILTATATFEEKSYSDKKTVSVPKTGHKWGEPEFKWNASGSSVEVTAKCQNDPEHTIDLEAKITSSVKLEATCTEPGTMVYTATATLEGKEYKSEKEVLIPKKKHSYGAPEFTWSEDYSAATAKSVCANDPTHVLEAKATVTSEEIKAATCTEEGTIRYTATAELNGETYTDTKENSIPKKNHSYSAPVFTWSEDYSTATAKSVCANDSTHVIEKSATVTKSEIKSATCTEDGTIRYTAKVEIEGKEYTEVKDVTIPKKNHSYAAPVFTWSEDYSTATAKSVCANDPTHILEAKATVTSEEIKAATCTEEGKIRYTATVELDGKTYTDTKDVTTEKLPHSYKDGRCTVCGAEQEYLPGDVNGSGDITSVDAVYVLRYLAGFKDEGINLKAADYNQNGSVSSLDAVLILRFIAGLE